MHSHEQRARLGVPCLARLEAYSLASGMELSWWSGTSWSFTTRSQPEPGIPSARSHVSSPSPGTCSNSHRGPQLATSEPGTPTPPPPALHPWTMSLFAGRFGCVVRQSLSSSSLATDTDGLHMGLSAPVGAGASTEQTSSGRRPYFRDASAVSGPAAAARCPFVAMRRESPVRNCVARKDNLVVLEGVKEGTRIVGRPPSVPPLLTQTRRPPI